MVENKYFYELNSVTIRRNAPSISQVRHPFVKMAVKEKITAGPSANGGNHESPGRNDITTGRNNVSTGRNNISTGRNEKSTGRYNISTGRYEKKAVCMGFPPIDMTYPPVYGGYSGKGCVAVWGMRKEL
jgi:hypothetical protein